MTQISVHLTRNTATPPTPAPQLDPRKQYFRGLHWLAEGGREIPNDVIPNPPAVIPAWNSTALPLTEDMQWFSFDFMRSFCSALTNARWRILHGHAIAMTNKGAGYGYGDNILRDYINQRDLTAIDDRGNPALPKYDKIRTFQGSIISGIVSGGYIVCQPGIDGIDARGFSYKHDIPALKDSNGEWHKADTPESLAMLKNAREKFHFDIAICIGDPPFHFRQPQWSEVCWICYPFFLDRETRFELPHFEPWREPYPPEPTRIYHRI